MLTIHPPAQPLADETVRVRLPAARDVEALVVFGDDSDVAETIWIPIPTPCSHEQAAERLAEFERGWCQDGRFGPTLVIADRASDEMVGASNEEERGGGDPAVAILRGDAIS